MLRTLSLFGLVALSAGAQDGMPELPQPVAQANFNALKSHSPFTRVLDFSETYSLRGVALIGNESVARLYNKTTKKTVTVLENQANQLGMKLVSVQNNPNDLSGVSVMISVGGEQVELRYDSAQIAPEAKPKVAYQKDSRGRAMPPKALMDNYKTMNESQRRKYYEWRKEYYSKNPGLERSEKRFPIVDKAISAIKAGKTPPR